MNSNDNGAAAAAVPVLEEDREAATATAQQDRMPGFDRSTLLPILRDWMRLRELKRNPQIEFKKLNESGWVMDHRKSNLEKNWQGFPLHIVPAAQRDTPRTCPQMLTVEFGFSEVTGLWIEFPEPDDPSVVRVIWTFTKNKKYLVPTSDMPLFVETKLLSLESREFFCLQEGQARSARQVIINFKQYVCSFVSTTKGQVDAALKVAQVTAGFSYFTLAGEIASAQKLLDAQLDAQQEALLDAQQEALLDAQQDAQLDAQQEALLDAQQDVQFDALQDGQLVAATAAQLQFQLIQDACIQLGVKDIDQLLDEFMRLREQVKSGSDGKAVGKPDDDVDSHHHHHAPFKSDSDGGASTAARNDELEKQVEFLEAQLAKTTKECEMLRRAAPAPPGYLYTPLPPRTRSMIDQEAMARHQATLRGNGHNLAGTGDYMPLTVAASSAGPGSHGYDPSVQRPLEDHNMSKHQELAQKNKHHPAGTGGYKRVSQNHPSSFSVALADGTLSPEEAHAVATAFVEQLEERLQQPWLVPNPMVPMRLLHPEIIYAFAHQIAELRHRCNALQEVLTAAEEKHSGFDELCDDLDKVKKMIEESEGRDNAGGGDGGAGGGETV